MYNQVMYYDDIGNHARLDSRMVLRCPRVTVGASTNVLAIAVQASERHVTGKVPVQSAAIEDDLVPINDSTRI
jgi:hypothetical protein